MDPLPVEPQHLESLHVDLLVIGWGKGGKTLAGTVGRSGKRVAMVEQSADMYGGTCINIGCVPTKTLLHDADQASVRGGDRRAGYAAAIDRKNRLTAAMRAKNFAMLDTVDTVTTITGRATFTGPKQVEVTGGDDRLTITADTVVINTGALPVLPKIPGIDGRRVLTSTDLIAGTELPGRLAVIGGGSIGLELANMYREFGSEVTVLEGAPAILGREDDDVAAAVREILTDTGITLLEGASVTEIVDGADAATVRYTVGERPGSVAADAVLVVVGRRPNTDGLGLAAAGVQLTERGAVRVDEHLRTTADGVFAVGDVNGGPQFTYVSLDDNRIVLDQLAGQGVRSTADRVAVPATTFITPPLARVGMTEREAVDAGHEVLVGKKKVAEVAAMPRPKAVAEPRGLLKLVVDADTDQLLGAAWLSVDGQEVINLLALAIRTGVTASTLRDSIWTHPSTTEGLNEVLGTLVPTRLGRARA
ncbi:dihydrolipoyl dehydrogenase family protein [Nakamurella lactea]|uniref:dihydrolipoyl dehydrogenase family protein n=1 Tax=Nakamurella lactea TaxID=459515 RepID=UPI00068641FB|nr:FAD-dependent oxidoreductase [Nakamurella lactea]